MRANLFLLLFFPVVFSSGQSKKGDLVNASFDNQSLEVIFDTLSAQTGYFFSYNSDLLPKGSLYTISAENLPVDQFLSRLLVGTGLKYTFFKDQIILNYEVLEEQSIRRKNYFVISGKVYDENNEPLKNVNIFLDGTTIGTSSGADGSYQLSSIPPGFYDIVFSHVGYENAIYQVSESNGGSRIQNHQMSVDLEQLEEVEIISDRIRNSENNWLVYYNTFKEELLGQSRNSANCVIENPEALNFLFDEATNTLKAFSDQPIQIRNEALGYRISYLLESFVKTDSDLRFRGRIRFRNSEPLSKGEIREWKRNRKAAYYGSFNHFKQALINEELKKEGYRIFKLKNIKDFELKRDDEIVESDIVVFKGDHYELDFKNYLIIEYRKESESIEFLKNSDYTRLLYSKYISSDDILTKNPGNQISIIKLLKNGVRLDLSGEVLDRFSLTTYGYWSWERTADLVPINYDPKYDNL
ncbi:MAG: carboxypeptidase-like regulatory domain-containing protein [Ekhidna sp.]|uniref:carboxypeptidase-like regulatory domain-containing protein n=1 Tax=Ekhidna sp. TaxID=2608089 RepID=UPI0032EAAB92